MIDGVALRRERCAESLGSDSGRVAAQRHRAHDISWSIVYLPTNSQHVQPSREGRRRLPLYPRLPGRQIYPLQVLQVLPRTLARPQADGTMGRSVLISLK